MRQSRLDRAGGATAEVALSLLGGTVLVLPAVSVPFTANGAPGVPGAGSRSIPLSLPVLPATVGANLNFQALLLDAGAAFALSMTNGLEMWIG